MAKISFWYEFASTYSYPAAMRIEQLARSSGVEVDWKPFLLGPIFKKQGWQTSPFNQYKLKGQYMWRDLQRICAAQGLAFCRPKVFPQHSLKAARLALTDSVAGKLPGFSRKVFLAEFAQGKDISRTQTLSGILQELGIDPARALDEADSPPVKARLRQNTQQAEMCAIFGAPSCLTMDGELFWGNDRLEQAVAWAANKGHITG